MIESPFSILLLYLIFNEISICSRFWWHTLKFFNEVHSRFLMKYTRVSRWNILALLDELNSCFSIKYTRVSRWSTLMFFRWTKLVFLNEINTYVFDETTALFNSIKNVLFYNKYNKKAASSNSPQESYHSASLYFIMYENSRKVIIFIHKKSPAWPGDSFGK